MFAQGFKATILNYFPSLKWLFVFVDWGDIWELEGRRGREQWGLWIQNLGTMREMNILFHSSQYSSFLKLCDKCIHFMKYLSTYIKHEIKPFATLNSDFYICLSLQVISRGCSRQRCNWIKKTCQNWKYSPPASIINMHWNWTFVKSFLKAEHLTWLKINIKTKLFFLTFSILSQFSMEMILFWFDQYNSDLVAAGATSSVSTILFDKCFNLQRRYLNIYQKGFSRSQEKMINLNHKKIIF